MTAAASRWFFGEILPRAPRDQTPIGRGDALTLSCISLQ
jgi:hypothetical protein